MKAFVTGATGLLGNNLVRQLHARDDHITGLVRSKQKAERLLGDVAAEWIVGDVRAPERFASALAGSDVLFHTAAYFREYYQPGHHQKALEETNVEATLALMRLVKNGDAVPDPIRAYAEAQWARPSVRVYIDRAAAAGSAA